MRKHCLIACLAMVTVISFIGAAWAGEASYFSSAINGLVRVYATQNTTDSNYSVSLEVIDTSNNIIPVSNLNGINSNPELITNAATSGDISLSCDDTTNTYYIFYANEGPDLVKYTITLKGPQLSVNTNSLPFGNVNTGSSSTMSLTLTNTGTGTSPLAITSIGNPGVPFSLSGCSYPNGQNLNQGAYRVASPLSLEIWRVCQRRICSPGLQIDGRSRRSPSFRPFLL